MKFKGILMLMLLGLMVVFSTMVMAVTYVVGNKCRVPAI